MCRDLQKWRDRLLDLSYSARPAAQLDALQVWNLNDSSPCGRQLCVATGRVNDRRRRLCRL